jgi:uncharacterized membrane protein YqjE
MDFGAPGSSGLLGSLRGFADGVVGSVQDRFELLSLELHEEKHRLIQVLIWLGLAMFGVLLALVFASGALVVAYWNTSARLPIVIGLAAVYAIGAIAAAFRCRALLASHTAPFSTSLNELRVDRECLLPKN